FDEQTIILKIVILYLIDIVGRDRASDQVVQEGEVETPASATGEHCDRMDERIPAVTDMISQLIAGGGEIVQLPDIVMSGDDDQAVFEREARMYRQVVEDQGRVHLAIAPCQEETGRSDPDILRRRIIEAVNQDHPGLIGSGGDHWFDTFPFFVQLYGPDEGIDQSRSLGSGDVLSLQGLIKP